MLTAHQQMEVPLATGHGNKVGIPIQCPSYTCKGRNWVYTGTSNVYASCPNCRKSVRIETYRIRRKSKERQS